MFIQWNDWNCPDEQLFKFVHHGDNRCFIMAKHTGMVLTGAVTDSSVDWAQAYPFQDGYKRQLFRCNKAEESTRIVSDVNDCGRPFSEPVDEELAKAGTFVVKLAFVWCVYALLRKISSILLP